MGRGIDESLLPAAIRQALQELGGFISVARKERKMTQQSLAERIGVTRMTIVRIETGAPEVAMGLYLTAAWVLGLPILSWQPLAKNRSNTSVGDLLQKLKESLPKRIRQKQEILDNDF